MVVFVETEYIYKPTPSRSKNTTTRRKPGPEQLSTLNKLQHIKSSSASLSTPRPAAAAAADDDESYSPGIQGTGTDYGGSDKANNDETDDDRDLPTIEELLFIKLQAQGFTTGVRAPGKTGRVEEVAADERGGSVDQSRSAQSDNSGGSPDDPIVLLGDGNLSASEAEANDVSLRAESATVPGAGLFDNLETAIDSITPAPPRSSDGWHDIDDFPEPAPRLRLAKQGASTPDLLTPHAPSSRLSTEPLHDSISTGSGATTPSSSPPLQHCRASLETQLSQEGHLHPGQGVAEEHKLFDHVLETLLDDERVRKQQAGQEKDEENSEDGDEGPQQAINIGAPVVTAERAGGSPRPANRQQSLPNLDPSPESSHSEAGSRSGGDSDDELNTTNSAEDDEKKPRPAKRKQLSSSHGIVTRKKRKRPQESSSRQRRPLSEPRRQYLKSHSSRDQCSRLPTSSSAKGRLPSPAPSMPQSIDTKMSLGDSNLSPSSRATSPTLTEITFRPHSAHCCSFTATIWDGCDGRGVSLAQLARLIANTGHVGKIDDFTIKPIEQHSYLLSGFSWHTLSSFTAEAGRDNVDTSRIWPRDGKAVDAGAFISRERESSSGDDDESGLSHSDIEFGSDGDGDGCSSEDELGRSGTRMNVPWDPIDEQRLLAYKKEGKSWKWIFRRFQGRTENSVRQRLSIVKRRGG